VAEAKAITLRRQLINHYRELTALVHDRPILIQELEQYAWKIGYVENYADRLMAKGLHYEILEIVGEQRKRTRDPVKTLATAANQRDVDSLAEEGYEIQRGDIVRKNALTCSVNQLKKMIDGIVRQTTGNHELIGYVTAAYFERTGKQYALPFQISIDIQRQAMKEVQEDLRRLREK
jgi:hypothetical protein